MKKLSIITSLLLACSTAFAAAPSFSGMEVKKIDGTTTFTEMDAGEALQITLQNVSDGGKIDTKRRFYVEKNYIKGQGIFSILSKNQVLWQSPKVAGNYKISSYLENVDGNSSIITQDVVVRDPFVSNSGRYNCPVNFVFVPDSQGLHGSTKGWCIMKYEASPYSLTDVSGTLENNGNTISFSTNKAANEFSTSKPLNSIYYNGTLSQAKIRCANVKDSNGNLLSNTSIISIDVWISLVRDLYKQPFNWTGNGIGSEILKVGHTDNIPSYPILSSYDDLDDSYLTGNSIIPDDSFNNGQRRTMKTSYNDVIWDIVGNTKEFFRENFDSNNADSYSYSFLNTASAASTFITPLTYNNTQNGEYKIDKYSYSNPYLNNTYLKLIPYNVLGFKPGIFPDKYLLSLSSNTTETYSVNSLTDIYNGISNFLITSSSIEKVYNTLYNINNADIYSTNGFVDNYSLGFGAYIKPNTLGKIGYNVGTGNPILYGGGFDAGTNTTDYNNFQIYSKQANSGLFAITSQTTYQSTTQIVSDTTVATAGFRCMTQAN